MWPIGAYTAAPFVDWRSENDGQYAQAKTVGIIRFVTSLFYFYPDFKWVSIYRYCINEICLSDGCRSILPVVNMVVEPTDIGLPEGDVYWTRGSIFITGGPILLYRFEYL